MIGVAQSPAKPLVVCEFLEFVLECIDEKARTRDIEDINDAIGALDEGFRGVEIDAGSLFSHRVVCSVYTYLFPRRSWDRIT